MTVGYRAVLRLDEASDAVDIANEQLRSWFRTKTGKRGTLKSTDWDGEGEHALGPDASLLIVKSDGVLDESRRQLARFRETNAAGTWTVSIYALSVPKSRGHSQSLVIEAGLEGATIDRAL